MNEKLPAGHEIVAHPLPEEFAAYVYLSTQDIARLVLCLLIEEEFKDQVASLLTDARWGISTAS